MKSPKELPARMARVKLVIFDVDGVLTDGSILLGADGREIKRFHVHDGTGIKYLERAGIVTAILSGRKALATRHRARELGIQYIQQGQKRKLEGLARIMKQTKIRAEDICFVGDDLPDIPVMRVVGLAVTVADARPEVLREAHWVTEATGGHGAAREICERILKAQGKWDGIIARYDLATRPPEEES